MKGVFSAAVAGLFLGLALVLSGCTATAEVAQPREQVVLLHGLGRSKTAMWRLASRLEEAGYQVHSIDYDSFRTSPEQIIASVEQDIAECCNQTQRPIHFVGHSLGGLVIRAYLERQRPDNLGQVVLIGTPNHGTDLVDQYKDRWWMKFAGETALSLGTDANSFPNSLPEPDYSLGVIAGIKEDSVEDDDPIPGADDGLVPVASTRLTGMRDFILLPVGHSAMRYDSTVAEQTIYYLQHGQFESKRTLL